MRYFIGLPLPKDLTAQVEALQQSWPQDRWPVHFRDQLEPHITIKAPFNNDEESWIEVIKDIAELSSEPAIHLEKVDFFTAKVIHLKVGSEGLQQLHQSIVQNLPANWLTSRERGPFLPHLTLAIANHKLPPTDQNSIVKWIHKEANFPDFSATGLRIYRKANDEPYQALADLGFNGNS